MTIPVQTLSYGPKAGKQWQLGIGTLMIGGLILADQCHKMFQHAPARPGGWAVNPILILSGGIILLFGFFCVPVGCPQVASSDG